MHLPIPHLPCSLACIRPFLQHWQQLPQAAATAAVSGQQAGAGGAATEGGGPLQPLQPLLLSCGLDKRVLAWR